MNQNVEGSRVFPSWENIDFVVVFVQVASCNKLCTDRWWLCERGFYTLILQQIHNVFNLKKNLKERLTAKIEKTSAEFI